jgi:hypothetical protein
MSDNGERGLLWELFLMVRELQNREASPERTRQQQEWAARFHSEVEALDIESGPAATSGADDDDDEPVHHRSRAHAKKKR